MSVTSAVRAKNPPEAHIISREVIHPGDAVRVDGRGDGQGRQQIRLGASADQQTAADLSTRDRAEQWPRVRARGTKCAG